MTPDPLDRPLSDGLGPGAAEALRAWAAMRGSTFRLHRWFPNGRSGALVGVVYEDNRYDGGEQLVLKLDRADGQRYDEAEYARHERAVDEAADFAGHLSRLTHQPVGVGDGRWITFQKVVGGSLKDAQVLSTLLDAARSSPGAQAASAFSDTCAQVIEAVLGQWAVKAHFSHLSVPGFLGLCLADRLDPGKPLRSLASTTAGDQLIPLPAEKSLLVNPFALLTDGPLAEGRMVAATLTGKAHGDLHTENVLIPAAAGPVPGPSFWLIDLAKYQTEGPLARDPAHLMLYVAARALPSLTTDQKDALLQLLVDPDRGPGHLLPGWLSAAITSMRAAGLPWARGRGLTDEWREQTRLAILACSLMFTVRKSLTEDEQIWFLRLAAHMATATVDSSSGGAAGAVGRPSVPTRSSIPETASRGASPAARDTSWMAVLCEHLPTIRRLADRQGLSREVEELLMAARLGHDASEPFDNLIRKIGGPSALTRGVPGLGGGQPVPGQVYACPGRCHRTERRAPGKAEPWCNINDHVMELRKW